ncbi:DNA polymerase III subunit epsilon [Propylenella binzhouense]|uniref:DNA polymerase III subunit epsilon n=1 Tax=Propylenella binzhouense TaxID=2555902 RepID=A0A964WSF8_9HYPH|nr:DNA polymerase III subunit epsilon [Propylenella binzhouense]MYZ46821.1 DNA polymerase III subunit epsilon [Propylenella binzhouense]
MREIVFDTETTGLNALGGDRLIEIGCVEILNQIPTGRTFHAYINPQRPVDPDAVRVHGLDDAFLADKPCFDKIVDAFLDFVGDSPLVAHNADFDRGFINMELGLCGRSAVPVHRFVDTLQLARRRHPNASNSLDALCARFGIDNSSRTKHGALLDAEILAEVYIELLGGRQAAFALGTIEESAAAVAAAAPIAPRARPLPPRITAADLAAHAAYVEALGPKSLWLKYRSAAASKVA